MRTTHRAIKFPRTLYGRVIAHCLRDPAKEACGILAGRAGKVVSADELWLVVEVYEMRNVENSPIGYSMDPREQLAVEKQMRAKRQQLLGIYHSHTATEAYPSSVDKSLAISPDVSYVIVSLKDRVSPTVWSYRIDGTRVEKEDVWIEEAPSGVGQAGRA